MLLRFDPFRDFDRLTEQLLGDGRTARPMPMDVYRSGEHYVLRFDVPGIDPGTVDLSVEDNVLTVRASRPAGTDEGVEFLVAERPTGEFSRQLVLGNGLDLGGIAATYDTGVLTVTIPVAETAKPRKIAVTSSGGGPKVIEGEQQHAAVRSGTS
ncbi:MAG: Hsp20/alpha crystallin family protein [Mycobacteriales bacterium]